ncbi:MAG: hypothetical protein Q9214_003274, partial [Letrouitia sp. 1 TL-2023]
YLLQKYGIPKEYASPEIEDLLSKNIDEAVERCIKVSVDLKMHRDLQSAVSAGDIEKAGNLLEQGADVNYCSIHANTLLFEATNAGNELMVRFLLNNKANVSLRQSYQDTRSLLDIGFQNISYSLLSLLADAGAKFSPKIEENAVTNAVVRGDERKIEMLLNKEYQNNYSPHDIRAAFRENRLFTYALLSASEFGHDTIVRLLIEKGVNVNQRDRRGSHALWMASERGDDKIVQLLLNNGADPNLHFGKNGTALHVATRESHVTIIRILIQKGADINMYSWRYGTPLYAASKHKSSRVIEVLLENGADPNTRSDEYGGALYSASENNSLAAVQLLLEKGADIHASVTRYEKPGCTPLQVASRRNHKDVVRILIDHGADVNNPASIDGNALYVASGEGHIEVMQQLLDAGANVSACNLGSKATSLSPLQIASKNGHESAVKLLLDQRANFNKDRHAQDSALYLASENPLDIALFRGHRAVVELLLERGFEISESPPPRSIRSLSPEESASPTFYSLLQMASENNHEHIVKLLLKRGVSPIGGIGDDVIESPLYLASKEGHTSIVRRLIDAGANISSHSWLLDDDPLQIATKNGHDEVIRLLLERGSFPIIAAASVDTSLYIAVAHRRDKAVELLLKFGADPDRRLSDHALTPRQLARDTDYRFLELVLDS